MRITVKRYSGLHIIPDIVEPILTDIRAALARGKAEMDAGEALQEVNITCLYTDLEPGDLIEIQDQYQGEVYRGKVVSVEHVAETESLKTNLTIVRK